MIINDEGKVRRCLGAAFWTDRLEPFRVLDRLKTKRSNGCSPIAPTQTTQPRTKLNHYCLLTKLMSLTRCSKNHWSDGHPSFPDTLPGVVPAIQRGNPQGINVHKIAQSQVAYVFVFDAFGLASDSHLLSSPCAKIFAGIRSLGLPYFGAEIGSVNDL